MAPALILYIIMVMFPAVYSAVISLFDWNGISEMTFVGLKNYITLFAADKVFRIAMKNTVIWMVLTIFVTVFFSLLLAVMLNRQFRGKVIYRAIFYFPYMLSWIVVGVIWKWMYNPNFGMINTILDAVGLVSLKGSYLSDPKLALICIFIAALWQSIGQPVLYFLAGLQSLPSDVLEAAQIDGAGKVASFFRVTIPLLKETFVIVLATQVINALKVYDVVYAMTDGGPVNSTQTLATYMYSQTFRYNHFGTGSAVAMIMVIMMIAIIIPYIKFSVKED